MTIAPERPAPADWYRDPSGLPEQRWWDGHRWTDLLRPVPAEGGPTVAVRAAAPGLRQAVPSRNTAARYALVFGLLSLVVNPFLAPSALAVVCGALGLRRVSRQVRAGQTPFGRAAAAWGLAAGLTGLVLTFLVRGITL